MITYFLFSADIFAFTGKKEPFNEKNTFF